MNTRVNGSISGCISQRRNRSGLGLQGLFQALLLLCWRPQASQSISVLQLHHLYDGKENTLPTFINSFIRYRELATLMESSSWTSSITQHSEFHIKLYLLMELLNVFTGQETPLWGLEPYGDNKA